MGWRSKRRVVRTAGLVGLAVGAILALGGMGGCYFVSSGSESRMTAAPVRVTAWPAVPERELDELQWASVDLPKLGAKPKTVNVAGMGAGAGVGTGEYAEPMHLAMQGGEAPAARSLRTASGLVRILVDKDERPMNLGAGFGSLFRGFEPNAWVQTGSAFGTTDEALNAIEDDDGNWRETPMRSPDMPLCAPRVIVGERSPVQSGIPFRIPPTPPDAPDGLRGVVLHLWALASNPYEREVMDEMRRRGWLVVDIDPEDDIIPLVEESSIDTILAIKREVLERSRNLPKLPTDRPRTPADYEAYRQHPLVKERDRLELRVADLSSPGIHLATDADVEAAARVLAERVDRTLGGNALAVDAILETVRAVYPETKAMPTVVMGFSGGGLSTPTVAARLREREGSNLKAVVIVGGAANLVETAAFSTFSDGGVRFETRPRADGENRYEDRKNESPAELVRKVGKRYLELSKLDPYHTAPALNGLPVLQAHAIWDTWVPAEGGELLTKRLGDPDMLIMPGGHGMLFYFLPKRKAWIADWVEEKCRH